MSAPGRCLNCGAPHEDGLAECRYCDVPIPGRHAGIECPRCGELASADRRACAPCGENFVKACIFCGQEAWMTAPQCPRCHEAFAGAEERKRQRDQAAAEAARQQQMMNLAQQGLGVAATVAAGTTGTGLLGGIVDALFGSDPAPPQQGWGQQGWQQKPHSWPQHGKPHAAPAHPKPAYHAPKPAYHAPKPAYRPTSNHKPGGGGHKGGGGFKK